MKKLIPTKKNYGSGSGRDTYESKLFRVVLWNSQAGINTVLEVGDVFDHDTTFDLTFDGNQTERLNTDCGCISALSPSNILKLIKMSEGKGKKEGIESIQKEIGGILGLTRYSKF